jgi:hypothetical protein
MSRLSEPDVLDRKRPVDKGSSREPARISASQKKLLIAWSVVLALQAIFLLARYLQLQGPNGRFGGDFICFWEAAVRARHGNLEAIYQPAVWRKLLAANAAHRFDWYVYPPISLLGVQFLGGMSYGRAAIVWSLIPLPAYFALVVAHARRSAANLARVGRSSGEPFGRVAHVALAGMTLPLLCTNLLCGQIGAIVAVLVLAAAYFWPDRPARAGLAIGLLAIKPQLGLLIPLALAAGRRWRTMIAASATVGGLIAASLVWFGPKLWVDYLQMTRIFGSFLSAGHGHFDQLALAPYVSIRAAGLPAAAAGAVQAVISIAAAVSVVGAFWRRGADREIKEEQDPRFDLRLGILATGALLATPYAMSYETPLLALAMIPLFVRAWRRGWDGLELAAMTGLVLIPQAQILAVEWRVPFAFCAVLFAFCALGRRYLLDAPARWAASGTQGVALGGAAATGA